jgi:tRNA (guanine26-N2/guanine27-N2)-dimethyltransferase
MLIKTGMLELLWDIMRCWVKQNPINKTRQENENDRGAKILAKEPKIEANFTPSEALQQQIKDKTKACRHPQNPEDFWGPKRRASGKDKLNTHGGAKVDSGEGGEQQKKKKKRKQKKKGGAENNGEGEQKQKKQRPEGKEGEGDKEEAKAEQGTTAVVEKVAGKQ